MTVDEQPESATTRERVRRAARELFGEKGYDGASMSELAERVGIAKPSLYNYYRSKEDILIDLVEEGIRDWSEVCMAPFATAASFERQLAEHLRLNVDFCRERPNEVTLFHLATAHVQGELECRVSEVVARRESEIEALFQRRIEEAVANGELDVDSPLDARIFIGIFFHGLLFLQANGQHHVGPLNERLPAIWKLLFRALSGRMPEEKLP